MTVSVLAYTMMARHHAEMQPVGCSSLRAADCPLGGIHAQLRKWFLVSSAAGCRPRDCGAGACAAHLVGAHLVFVKSQPVCRAAAVLYNTSQRFRIPNPQGTRPRGR